MKKTLILAALLTTVCITPALAYREITIEEKTDWYFDAMDANNDDAISSAEHEVFWSAMFARADRNHDGYLSYDELLAAKKGEYSMLTGKRYYKSEPIRLPNRVNANPSDRSINKGYSGEASSRYLGR